MQLIDNQPISFRSSLETDSACNLGDRKQYCQLYELGDRLKAQWIADPCDTFECDLPSQNALLNSEFTGGSTNWALANGATYNSNAIDFAPNGSGSQLSQTVSLNAGNCYLLIFTVSDYSAGTVTPTVGGTAGTVVSANGVYYQIIIPTTDNISLAGNAAADLTIDDVTLNDLSCYCPDNGNIFVNTEVASTDGSVCHIAGTATTITIGTTLTVGKYYGISIVISNQTQGSVRIVAGTEAGEWFTNNGVKTSFLTSDGTTLTIEMDSDFDGCVSFLASDTYPALEDWEIALTDLDGVWVQEINTSSITEFLRYDNDFVTLDWYISGGAMYYQTTPEGCYKICIIEPCVEHSGFVYGSRVFEDDFDNGSQWTLDSGITIADVVDGGMSFITTGLGGVKTATVNSFPFTQFNGCSFVVRLNFLYIDSAYLGSTIDINIGGDTYTINIDADLIDAGYVEFSQIVSVADSFSIDFDNSVDPMGGSPPIYIESMFVKLGQECLFNDVVSDYCSNCISIKEEHPCTVRYEAYCEEPALGFNFDNFSLIGRLRTLFINPYTKARNENYKYSNGTYNKNFAEKDKIWEVLFDYCDEIAHDVIGTALVCDTLLLYNPVNLPTNSAYIWVDDSYKPEWDKSGQQKLAQSRIELRKADGGLTNSNCS